MNIAGELKAQLGREHALLRFTETATTLSVDVLLVPPAFRARGVGTNLLNRALCLADMLGREARVAARPIGTSGAAPLERLVAWYRRFGFEEFERGVSVVYMRRVARAPLLVEPSAEKSG